MNLNRVLIGEPFHELSSGNCFSIFLDMMTWPTSLIIEPDLFLIMLNMCTNKSLNM